MAVALIEATDTLNAGRTKLNDAIQWSNDSLAIVQAQQDDVDAKIIEASTAIANANTAITAANTAATTANTAATNADTKAAAAETVANDAATTATAAQSVVNELRYIGEYNAATTYKKNNTARYNGNLFISRVDNNVGNTPNVSGDTEFWALAAQRGVDGTGAVSTVNSIAPDAGGNVALTKANIGLTNVDDVQQAAKIDFDAHIAATKTSAHLAKNITVEDTAANFTSAEKTAENIFTELFTSVSSGKNLLKTAVTDKGGTVTQAGTYPTFAELDTGIRSIAAGGAGFVRIAKGSVTASGGYASVSGVAGFDFKPILIFLKALSGGEMQELAMYIHEDVGNELFGIDFGPYGMIDVNNDAIAGNVVSTGIGSFNVQVPSNVTYNWFVIGQ